MPENNLHPITSIFPRLEGDDFDALVDDIRRHGLREAIWRHRNGEILDGDNRWRACQVLGINCPSRTFEGDDSEILAFVISQNLHRRHLDTSQRAMIAAKLASLEEGRPKKTAQFCAVSQDQAADLLNVSRRTVQDAAKVRREGVPELVRAVEQGQLPVSRAAAIATAEPARQRRIVAGEEPAVRPDDEINRRIRIVYSEPDEPIIVRIRAADAEPQPRPDLTRMVTERPALPAELYRIRDALLSTPLSPERAAAAIPDDHRAEFIHLAQRRQAWIAEFLRLLSAKTDRDDRHCGLSRAE